MSALYTSLERITALIEATDFISDDDPTVPFLMFTVEYAVDRVLNPTDPEMLRLVDTTMDELTRRIPRFALGTAATQQLGHAAFDAGVQAILAPSRAQPGGTNLVLFPDALRTGAFVIYDEPPGRYEDEDLPPNVIRFPRELRNG